MLISVVIPLLNEQGNLLELHDRLVAVFRDVECDYQLIFVDDGSTDGSDAVLRDLASHDPKVGVIRLTRNFGHELASTAGLDAATGDAIVLMDADLQDPPEVIEEMIQAWRSGAQIVYAVRRHRQGESWFKRSTSWMFYRMLNVLSDVPIPMDAGDFRLIDKQVLTALRACRESDRFVRGLVAWTGFRSKSVVYDRPPRKSGVTKYRPLKLLLLSLDASVGFSIKPLRLATAAGFLVTMLSLVMVVVIVMQKLIWGIRVEGYALLASGLFFLGGVQLLMLGIIGEYLGRVYRQTQNRPLYLVSETIGRIEPATSRHA